MNNTKDIAVPLAQSATQPIAAQQTLSQKSTDMTAGRINYSSLNLMNSTKGLLDGGVKHAKAILPLLVVAGVAMILLKSPFMGMIILFVCMGYIAKLQSDRNSKLWKQFAIDNGWRVDPAGSSAAIAPPTIALRGRAHKLSDVISGTFSGTTFKCYTYTYTVGSGKNSTTHVQTIMQIILQKPLPSFLLDSTSASVVKDMPSNFEHVSLEGDFDKSFKLYAPKDAITDVLSVISPDTMQTLIQKNTFQDIQSENGSIWFMQHGDTRQQNLLPALFVAIEGLMPDFYHRLKSYSATNIAAHTYSGATTQGPHSSQQVILNVPVSKNKYHLFFIAFMIIFMLFVFGFMSSVFFILGTK